MNLLAARHDSLSLAKVDAADIAFDSRDSCINDSTDFIFVLVHNNFALSFTQALQDNLLGCLGSDAAKTADFFVNLDHIALGGIFFHNTSLDQTDFVSRITNSFNYFFDYEGVDLTSVEIHGYPDFLLTVAVIAAVGSGQSLLDGFLNGLLG